MRKRLRNKLEKQGQLPAVVQPEQRWTSHYPGESKLIERFRELQSRDPLNSTLDWALLKDDHLQLTFLFYYRNPDVPCTEIPTPRAAFCYLATLSRELQKYE